MLHSCSGSTKYLRVTRRDRQARVVSSHAGASLFLSVDHETFFSSTALTPRYLVLPYIVPDTQAPFVKAVQWQAQAPATLHPAQLLCQILDLLNSFPKFLGVFSPISCFLFNCALVMRYVPAHLTLPCKGSRWRNVCGLNPGFPITPYDGNMRTEDCQIFLLLPPSVPKPFIDIESNGRPDGKQTEDYRHEPT